MTKAEFLDGLRQALSGKVHYSVVNENVRYYEDYIDMQMKKGMTEEAVLEGLGDPRLIARTIVEASAGQGAAGAKEHTGEKRGGKDFLAHLPGWAVLILVFAAAAVLIGVFTSVMAVILPVLVPAAVVLFLINWFKRRR